jgi:hypothetical protein
MRSFLAFISGVGIFIFTGAALFTGQWEPAILAGLMAIVAAITTGPTPNAELRAIRDDLAYLKTVGAAVAVFLENVTIKAAKSDQAKSAPKAPK